MDTTTAAVAKTPQQQKTAGKYPKQQQQQSVTENVARLMSPAWLEKMRKGNGMLVRKSCKVIYPAWKIVSGKYVKLEYNFETQEIKVYFQHESAGGLKLKLEQWNHLKSAAQLLITFAETLGKSPEEALRMLPNTEQLDMNNETWNNARINFDANLAFEVRWKSASMCLVDLRLGRTVYKADKVTFHSWTPNPNCGILFSMMGFMHFAKILIPFVDAGIHMWTKMAEASPGLWANCVPCFDEEEEIDGGNSAVVANATPAWNYNSGNPYNIQAPWPKKA